MTRRLRSLLCRLTGHRWQEAEPLIRGVRWSYSVSRCARCLDLRIEQASDSPGTSPEPFAYNGPSWIADEEWWASRRGTAATAPDALPDIHVAYSLPLALLSEWGYGADGTWSLRLRDDVSLSPSSTGAPVPSEHSTSTATPSSGSLPSRGES